MNYEKKYKEALGKAEDFYNDKDNIRYANAEGMLEEIFPELKESEDEKIRKTLIDYFNTCTGDYYGELKRDSILAWLEKQSKESKVEQAMREVEEKAEAFTKAHKGETSEEILAQMRGEQKSADKVETKFKVGDWIINRTDATIMHIINTKDFYESVKIGGQRRTDTYNYVEWDFRLWTIKDAKPGDVLYFNDNTIVIFKDLYNATTFHSYCHIEDGVFDVSKDDMPDWWEGKGFHPATKNQRDLLFSKMKEAGYEWDPGKKELRKIDNEEVNGEDYGIDGLWHAQRILEKTLGSVDGYQTDDGILDHKAAITAVKKLYKQKLAWSEEDETYLDHIITAVKLYYTDDKGKENPWRNELVRWLKSLKQRYTWKPK